MPSLPPTYLPSIYDPHQHETAVYKRWQEADAFTPKPRGRRKKPFVIMLPPPNVTGSLHMGHALQHTLIDILIRYHRLRGEETLWVPGTDHAAIATNKVIENQLHQEGKTRYDIGREEFLKRTEAWYEKTGNYIINQMKRLGSSADWSRTRFTMDPAYYQAVQEAFIHYFEKGYIYRDFRLVNWDHATATTVSDLEVEWRTEKTPLYTLQYGPFRISTARPETKFGDKYVVMHPEDKRYNAYRHGDTFGCEWINGPIKATVIKDAAVDSAFGTGVMTITPWHDAVDFEIAQRHHLDMEQIIDLKGQLLPIAGEFAGMKISEARSKIVAKLQQKGLIVAVDEAYQHNVAINERGKGVIEPQVMRQWFMKMEKLKQETIAVAKKEETKFIPSRWKNHFIHWMENVRDWNINRQIWLGHRLPVWWKPGTHGTDHEEGNYVVSIEKPPSLAKASAGDWKQDPDVLDTWFSSALWPFAALGWPENSADLKRFYPTSVLVTSRDILYLWVARMMFSGLELMQGEKYGRRRRADRIPFRHVLIHPVVLAKNGQRMSKSLGTGVDPLDLIKNYGADATRFGLMMQMNFDQQAMKFDEAAIRSARNFANKIWNIARFLETLPSRGRGASVADQWIQQRLGVVTTEVTQLLESWRVGEAVHTLYEFIWHDLADWYIEIIKHEGSPRIAHRVFERSLQLLHPFMPHLTETLWQPRHPAQLLMTHRWPATRRTATQEASHQMEYFQEIVTTVRSLRVLLGLKLTTTLHLRVEPPIALAEALQKLTGAELSPQPASPTLRVVLPSGRRLLVGSGAVTAEQLASARQRLDRELVNTQKTLDQQRTIIEQMRPHAAPEVVKAKEENIKQLARQLAEINRSLTMVTVDNSSPSVGQ